eukprot:TRINITY_DN15341_c0_g1_i3.p1 TRINITY_DN15341_c0_g1~~TRINITY_DN15341_c0_g1_i3.p1  ORF type:complete len:360 (-),score=73.90 TRINITY_DN15341_c0_g1_i3:37-1116(-)
MSVSWTAMGPFMFFHLERCFVFYCDFIVAKEYQLLAQDFGVPFESISEKQDNALSDWIWKNKQFIHHRLLSFPKLVACSLSIGWALCLFSLIYLVCYPSLYLNFYDDECQKSVHIVWYFYQVVHVCGVTLVWSLRNKLVQVEENVGFKEELNFHVTLSALYSLTWIYFIPAVSSYLGQGVLYIYRSIADLLIIWSLCTDFLKTSSPQTSSSNVEVVTIRTSLNENIADLRRILHDDGTCFAEFEFFLRLRFSAENAYYWKAVEKLKGIADHNAFMKRAKLILHQFLIPGSAFQLNLSSELNESIEKFSTEDFSSVSPHDLREMWISLLESAQQEVLVLMAKSLFVDFKATRTPRTPPAM